MNKPDIKTQQAILVRAIREVEIEHFSMDLANEATKAAATVEDARERLEKLHAYYAAKLNELV